MRKVERSALVPYTPAQMFALVEDIERYPQFVPWVAAAALIERTATQVTAQLEMERSGFREKFTTRNLLDPPRRMELTLVDGPFRVLEGRWSFDPIGDRGTKIGLIMQFEFSNPMLSLMLSKTFEKSCAQLVDAFVARARTVYGVA
ncbi:type II toxin-antitoxin system RatA family toxin [Povalibacter sp.]|uniref:type II toxin-antitoxin system RatA family toxin n=1 Tax=Povalibacter sp. TaxID=1962978 RepID=UPI002F3EAE1B